MSDGDAEEKGLIEVFVDKEILSGLSCRCLFFPYIFSYTSMFSSGFSLICQCFPSCLSLQMITVISRKAQWDVKYLHNFLRLGGVFVELVSKEHFHSSYESLRWLWASREYIHKRGRLCPLLNVAVENFLLCFLQCYI